MVVLANDKPEIFIGTVLMEMNRWGSRIPSFLVSDWIERFKADGFDGIELWENHALLAEPGEFKKLETSRLSIAIYNSYASFDDSPEAKQKRERAAAAAGKLGAKGVKFNFGNEPTLLDTYIRNFNEWVKMLPPDCRLLCECHPDTVMEDPETAGKVLAELAEGRCRAIIHPFSSLKMTEEWFKHLGSRITHAHISIYNDKWQGMRLKDNQELVEEGLRIMNNYVFKGTYTIEFTEGIRAKDENIEGLYRCAVDDLRYLRERII
jgi:sugar phosphate isomerase/epimerase